MRTTFGRLNRPTVGATYKDIYDQLHFHLAPLKDVAASFLTISINPPNVHVWTLLHGRDERTDAALAGAELKLMTSFSTVDFDFTTVHLQKKRDPLEFVPEGAVPVIARDPTVLSHFLGLLSATHAGA